MLDQLRAVGRNFLAKLLLAFLVLTFAVWGIGDMVRQSGRNITVATVGHTAITGDQFMRELRLQSENLRQGMGDQFSPELLKSLHLPQQVMQKLISHTLLKLESESLGIVPSDAEVVRLIREDPSFQDSKGHFDKSLFETRL